MLKIVRSSWGSNPWPSGGPPQHFQFKISAKQNHDSIRISGSCFWVVLLVQSQLWMVNCKIFRLEIISSFSSQLDWWIPPLYVQYAKVFYCHSLIKYKAGGFSPVTEHVKPEYHYTHIHCNLQNTIQLLIPTRYQSNLIVR